MAKKEERIFIGFINPEGDSCPVPYGKCNSLCDNCQGGITRQEAIERMAKAICNMGDEETWRRVDDNYKHYCTAQAEWALNALLSKGE